MSLKRKLLNLLPSYRNKNAILAEINILHEEMKFAKKRIDSIKKSIDDLDEKNEYLFWLSQKKDGEAIEETQKRVFLDSPKATGELRKIQLANFEILKELKAICDKHDIHFYLLYGTLLGAVRHNGFIPWDDDIDIGMLRSDCEKLFNVLKENKKIEINNYYNFYYGSKFVKVKFKDSDAFFVDIFLFDYVDLSENELDEKFSEIRSCQLKYSSYIDNLCNEKKITNESLIKPIKYKELDILANEYKKKITDSLVYYGYGEYVCYSIDKNITPETIESFFYKKVDLFHNKVTLSFEGIEFEVFSNYNVWLKNQYGDIWKFPSKIMPHHLDEINVADLNKLDFQVN